MIVIYNSLSLPLWSKRSIQLISSALLFSFYFSMPSEVQSGAGSLEILFNWQLFSLSFSHFTPKASCVCDVVKLRDNLQQPALLHQCTISISFFLLLFLLSHLSTPIPINNNHFSMFPAILFCLSSSSLSLSQAIARISCKVSRWAFVKRTSCNQRQSDIDCNCRDATRVQV